MYIYQIYKMHNVKISAIYLSLILCRSPSYVQSKTFSKQFLNRIRTANMSQQRPPKQFTQYVNIIKYKKKSKANYVKILTCL